MTVILTWAKKYKLLSELNQWIGLLVLLFLSAAYIVLAIGSFFDTYCMGYGINHNLQTQCVKAHADVSRLTSVAADHWKMSLDPPQKKLK